MKQTGWGERGTSLASVLIATGIISVVIVGLISVMGNLATSSRQLLKAQDMDSTLRMIKVVLGDEALCSSPTGGIGGRQVQWAANPSADLPVAELKVNSQSYVVTSAASATPSQAVVSNMKLTVSGSGLGPLPGTVVENSGGSTITLKKYLASFVVKFVPLPEQAAFRDRTVPVTVFVNEATNAIHRCFAGGRDNEAEICENVMGGQYDASKSPSCLMKRVVVADSFDGRDRLMTRMNEVTQNYASPTSTVNNGFIALQKGLHIGCTNAECANTMLTLEGRNTNPFGIRMRGRYSSAGSGSVFSEISSYPNDSRISLGVHGPNQYAPRISFIGPEDSGNNRGQIYLDFGSSEAGLPESAYENSFYLRAVRPFASSSMSRTAGFWGPHRTQLMPRHGVNWDQGFDDRIKIGGDLGSYSSDSYTEIDSPAGMIPLKLSVGADQRFYVGEKGNVWMKGDDSQGARFFTASNSHFRFFTNGETNTPALVIGKAGNLAVRGCMWTNYDFNSNTWGSQEGTCASDQRLKENINKFNLGLKEVVGLQPVTYRFKSGVNHDLNMGKAGSMLGLIAQDVEKVAPEIIAETPSEINGAPQVVKGVNYSALIYMVINAIRELYEQLTGQQNQIAKLESENAKLREVIQLQATQIQEIHRRLDRVDKVVN